MNENSVPYMRRVLALLGFSLVSAVHASPPQISIVAAEFENDEPLYVDFVNPVIGWDAFFDSGFRGGTSVIGNLESGTAWFGHQVFDRPPGSPDAFTVWNNPASDAANETDFHATGVVHVLAGSGYIPDDGGAYTFVGLGMAPEARVVSGGIATGFSSTDFGAFTISTESMVVAYRDFFQGNSLGEGISALDVINSSWGGTDGGATSPESVALDGLAFQNPHVAHVVSAGNGGVGSQVSAPASGYNSIAVGSTGGRDFLTPSVFSSGGFADFFNPMENGGTLHAGVRVAVDLAAPGENFFLAAYLGASGAINAALPEFVQEPSPTDQYFIESSGTSYAAPIVAGGVALIKDLARVGLSETPEANPASFDTRVIKSVLMAGSRPTEGWDNGQDASNITTQALDAVTGAGMIDLLGAANVYLGETRGFAADVGGEVSATGWTMNTINLTEMKSYVIDTPFSEMTTLTVALNWFAVRGFDDDDLGTDIAFANLDLQVWLVGDGGSMLSMVGESRTIYNNTEFLRLDALAPGQYAMRVLFPEMIYDTTGGIGSETYSLAWNAVAIPEPGVPLLAGMAVLMLLARRKPRK